MKYKLYCLIQRFTLFSSSLRTDLSTSLLNDYANVFAFNRSETYMYYRNLSVTTPSVSKLARLFTTKTSLQEMSFINKTRFSLDR